MPPGIKKLLGLIHLTGYLVHPLMLGTLLLMLPVGLFSPLVFRWMPFMMIAAFAPPLMYLLSETEHLPMMIDRLRLIPVLTLIGFGLSLNNAVAALEGLFGKGRGIFLRTPKFNLTNGKSNRVDSRYSVPISRIIWGEMGLGFYALISGVVLALHLGLLALPWLLVYSSGFFYIAGLNLEQSGQLARKRTRVTASVKAG